MKTTMSANGAGVRLAWAARLSALLLTGALVLGIACGGDSDDDAGTLQNPNEMGTSLATRFLELLQRSDRDGLQSFFSDAFIIQRANGTFMDKETYLNNLPEIRDFTVSEVTAKQVDNTLIVRWQLVIDETIDGAQYATDPAPRLSTFVYESGEWRMASHANFNAPEGN